MKKEKCKIKAISIFLLAFLVILGACSTNKKDWQKAKRLMSIQAFEDFVKTHSKSEFIDSATFFIEKLSFQQCQIKNTDSVYINFINQFPNSIFSDSAKYYREVLAFEKAINEKSDSSYNNFISLFPNSNFSDSIKVLYEKLDFDKARESNEISKYISFIEKYPESQCLNEIQISNINHTIPFRNNFNNNYHIFICKSSKKSNYLESHLTIPAGTEIETSYGVGTVGNSAIKAIKEFQKASIEDISGEYIEFSPYTGVFIEKGTVLLSGKTGVKFKRLPKNKIQISKGTLYMLKIHN